MRLHHLVGGSTGPGCSLLHFYWRDNIFNQPKQPSFYPGYVLPSNDLFTSDRTRTLYKVDQNDLLAICKKLCFEFKTKFPFSANLDLFVVVLLFAGATNFVEGMLLLLLSLSLLLLPSLLSLMLLLNFYFRKSLSFL